MGNKKDLLMQIHDHDTLLHCRRVEALISGYVKDNPDVFSLGQELIIAARIHDIGKNMIPDSILNADRKLTPEERDIINAHSYYSYVMAKEEGYPEVVCQMILLHHGDDKPFCNEPDVSAEIKSHADFLKVVDTYDELLNVKKHADFLRILDAYDALRNPRAYHNGRTDEKVFEILRESPGDFPPDIVDQLQAWEGRNAIQKAFQESGMIRKATSKNTHHNYLYQKAPAFAE